MSPRSKRKAETHIPDPIAALAAEAPDHVIVRNAAPSPGGKVDVRSWTNVRSWTAAAFDRWIHQIEHRLVTSGIAPGSAIAVFAPRRPSTIALLWAIWRVGGIAIPLNTRQPPSEAVDQASQANATLLISSDPSTIQAAKRSGMQAATFDEFTASPESEPRGSADGSSATFPEEASLRASLLPLDARATGVFTSGSTGTPKIAVHTLGNHVYSARGSAENIPLRRGDQWLASLPLYHVGGLAILFRCALAGATVAVPADDMPVAQAISSLRPTHVSLVATQLKRLLESAETHPDGVSSLKAILLGGSAIPSGLLDAACAHGWPVHTSYGSTEMASQIATTPPNASRDVLRSSGRCLPHRTVTIRDTRGEILNPGEEGEICVGGKTLFAGYATSSDENGGSKEGGVNGPLDAARTAADEFRTGDLGRIDREGLLYVSGRADRLIISGGENIQPEEIEAAIEQCAGVLRAAVVAVPDEEFGQRPVAFVEWKNGPRDLTSDLRDRLAGYKLPDAVHPMPKAAIQHHLKVDYKRLERAARKLRNA